MFLGGTILPLLVSGPAAADIRIAKDVDLMVHVPTKQELWDIEDHLWDVGLRRRSVGSVCHWRLGEIHVDVMMTSPDTVDFVNRWGVEAMRNAQQRDIGGGLLVKVMRSPHYVAKKLEAFYTRGKGIYSSSVDMSDIRLVLRGCPEFERDLEEHTSPELRVHLTAELEKMAENVETEAS
jgi:hypothetical protein